MRIRPAIAQLGTYKPPLEGRNPRQYSLMDFNESPTPPAPHVTQALQAYFARGELHIYPQYGDFCEVLSAYAAVPASQLMITNGSDQGIDVILRCLLDREDNIVMAMPGFTMFRQVAGTIGCEFRGVPYSADLQFPEAGVRAAIDEQTRAVVVINPNNPTGTSATAEQVEALLRDYPNTAIVVDEAYFEFTGKTSASLIAQYPNLMIIRTFSKAFAIPSLRLGYVIAREEVIQELLKIRGPYDVNMAAIVAARAQLENPEEWQRVVRHLMDEVKPALERYFQENGVKFYPGEANYLLVEPAGGASPAVEFLKEKGILVRPMRPPIDHLFRMNLRQMEDTQRFMEVFAGYCQRR
jgi:histidinol-phosphate aminotransferase